MRRAMYPHHLACCIAVMLHAQSVFSAGKPSEIFGLMSASLQPECAGSVSN